jgi:hypothetical protein
MKKRDGSTLDRKARDPLRMNPDARGKAGEGFSSVHGRLPHGPDRLPQVAGAHGSP